MNEKRKMWTNFWRALRKNGRGCDWGNPDPLARKARRAAEIAAKAEGGVVLVHESGYDCDWTYGEHTWTVPATLVAVERAIEDVLRWAENRTSVCILAPSERPDRNPDCGRNLVEEAFEDGHQHCVHPF